MPIADAGDRFSQFRGVQSTQVGLGEQGFYMTMHWLLNWKRMDT
jgi:hypothetical protein